MRTKLSKVLALFLALVFAFGCFPLAAMAAEEGSGQRTMQEWNEILNTVDYEEYLADNADTDRGSAVVTVDATKYVSDATTDTGVKVLFDVNMDGEYSLHTSDNGKVSWKVDVPKAGLYTLELLCYPGDATLGEGETEKATDVERILYINGKVPFSEARSLTITKKWAPQYLNGRFDVDDAGNEIRPDNASAVSWITYAAKDATGYYADPLQFYFEAGENMITLEATREPMAIKTITLKPLEERKTYADYLSEITGKDITSADEMYLPYLEEHATKNADDYATYVEESVADAYATKVKEIAKAEKKAAKEAEKKAKAAAKAAQQSGKTVEETVETPKEASAAVAVLAQEDYLAIYSDKTAADYSAYTKAERDAAIAAKKAEVAEGVKVSADTVTVDVLSYTEYLEENLAKKAPTFAEYYNTYLAPFTADKGQDMLHIEMETPDYQSDESIYPLTDRTSAVTSPQDPKLQLLNFMGGSENFKTVGQWTEYTFNIATEGFYTISIRSKQNDLSGMFASRALYIDGEIPFAECTELRFDYSKDWKVESVTDGTTEFAFYLTPGEHTLRIEVSLGQFADIIRQVESSLNNINGCYLDIMKLTGADPDEYRDYGFERLMPNTIRTMLIESRNLYRVSENITKMTGEKGSQTATLDKVAFLLQRMGGDEDEIAPNLDNLKTYIGTLGTWLNSVRSQPVRMDYILIQPSDAELPRANASFFEAIGFELKAFIESFFTDYSMMGAKTDPNANITKSIEVWTTEGRDQAKILKNLVAGQFTANTNIGVNVKLVAGGTLLPSVLSGQGPDAFLGAGGTEVINYAIRNAVLPLNDFDGFDAAISEFHESTVKPVTLYGTTYGMPERVAFAMMFVRIDILADLGLEIPKTWDDVLAMLPVLQANNMSIGLNKDYDIFLYQMGGDRFADDGLRCGLDSNIALEAFEKYTRFYTDYSFPYTFDGANRFRTGEMPILIADYSSTYNQLTVFATEIDGLWEMVPLPGTVREDGTINYNAVNAVAATIMLHGTEDEESTWEFIRWFCGHEAQAAYGSDLVTTIGQAAKYNTANRLAIAEMPWTTSEYTALSDQFNHLSAIENYPGAYIFARYLSFAQLAVVNDGADPVTELQSYVTTINKEITRKRAEFDLPTLDAGKTYQTMPEVKAEMEAWLAENGR